MAKYEAIVAQIYRVQRKVQVEADHPKWARLAAEDPENWIEETPLNEDILMAELTGLDVQEVKATDDAADG